MGCLGECPPSNFEESFIYTSCFSGNGKVKLMNNTYKNVKT